MNSGGYRQWRRECRGEMLRGADRVRDATMDHRLFGLLRDGVAEEEGGNMPRLRWNAATQRIQQLHRWQLVTRWQLVGAIAAPCHGEKHRANLEDGKIRQSAGEIAPGDRDQSWKQRGAKRCSFGVDRVGERDGRHGAIDRRAEKVVRCLRKERIRQHLGESGRRERARR